MIELAESACAGLSEAEKASVFGETAARWYAMKYEMFTARAHPQGHSL